MGETRDELVEVADPPVLERFPKLDVAGSNPSTQILLMSIRLRIRLSSNP
jgi:hypothetical protein